jgi:hypothetical protein
MNSNAGRRGSADNSNSPDPAPPERHRADRPSRVWLALLALLVPLAVIGCDAGRNMLMLVYNYTGKDIVVVHQDDGEGGERALKDSTGHDHLGPGGTDTFEVVNYDWCSHGTFIARTTDGVEIDRKTASPTTPSICGTWTLGTPPPSARSSPTPTPTPRPSPSPAPSRTPHPAATDIDPGGTAVPQQPFGPDEFWYRTGGGAASMDTYASGPAMLRAADLVVVGTLDRYERGPTLPVAPDGTLAYFSQMTLSVTGVISGNPISAADAPGTVTVIALQGFAWDLGQFRAYAASAPIGQRVVLFLRNSVAETVRGGQDPKSAGVGPEVYVMLNGLQAWVRDDGGTARVYKGELGPRWMQALDGMSFEAVVQGFVEQAAAIP